jgi:hypothetical protein
MKDLFTSYQIALIAKEKGFNEPCFRQIGTSSKAVYDYGIKKNSDLEVEAVITLPLYQQIVDWLREEKLLYIEVNRSHFDGFLGVSTFNVKIIDARKEENVIVRDKNNQLAHSDYYEALNKAIEEAFKLI